MYTIFKLELIWEAGNTGKVCTMHVSVRLCYSVFIPILQIGLGMWHEMPIGFSRCNVLRNHFYLFSNPTKCKLYNFYYKSHMSVYDNHIYRMFTPLSTNNQSFQNASLHFAVTFPAVRSCFDSVVEDFVSEGASTKFASSYTAFITWFFSLNLVFPFKSRWIVRFHQVSKIVMSEELIILVYRLSEDGWSIN